MCLAKLNASVCKTICQSLTNKNTYFAIVSLMLESKNLQLDDNTMLLLKVWYLDSFRKNSKNVTLFLA